MSPYNRAVARPRIVFVRLGAIGDVARTLPALSLVRKHLPLSLRRRETVVEPFFLIDAEHRSGGIRPVPARNLFRSVAAVEKFLRSRIIAVAA